MAGGRNRHDHTSEPASAVAAALAQRGRQPIAPPARWLEEKRDAIMFFNEWVELHGLPLGKFRQF